MKRRIAGFTLIELVVTVAIVGVLASVAVPLVEVTVQRTKEQELRSSLRQIREALDAHKLAVDEGRVRARADGNGYPARLSDLVDGVPDARRTDGASIRFLRRVPRDPFQRDAGLASDQGWGLRSYSSSPDAPSAGEDVYDVYSLSSRIGMNGRPYREW
jgi:general secretion pathway protein G